MLWSEGASYGLKVAIGTKYTVSLYRFGEQLWPVPTRIKSLSQLQAAIRCVLLALKDPYAANFAHTDIWWPNVIQCSNNAFSLSWGASRNGKAWPQAHLLARQDPDQGQVHRNLRLVVGESNAETTCVAFPSLGRKYL